MPSERRGLGRPIRIALLSALLLLGVNACSAVMGGGAAVALITIGALTSHCYDYLDVSVFDDQGRKTCAARVTAESGSDQFELKSCYYAPLTDGRWTLRASLPGFPDATSTVQVEHTNDCTRHVQSVELTLNSAGATPPRNAPISSPIAPIPALPPAPSAPAAPQPSSAPAPSAQPPASVPAPDHSASPPVGVFPTQTDATQ